MVLHRIVELHPPGVKLRQPLRIASTRMPMPVARYYSENYRGKRLRSAMRFASPEALVDYASEHLLLQMVLRARTAAVRARLYMWALCVACALLIAAIGWGARLTLAARQDQHVAEARRAQLIEKATLLFLLDPLSLLPPEPVTAPKIGAQPAQSTNND